MRDGKRTVAVGRIIPAACVILLLANCVYADDQPPPGLTASQLLQQSGEFLDSLHSLAVDIVSTETVADGISAGETKSDSARIWINRPGQVFWEGRCGKVPIYYVNNGQTAYYYYPTLGRYRNRPVGEQTSRDVAALAALFGPPLGSMLTGTARTALASMSIAPQDLGIAHIDGTRCRHIRCQGGASVADIWLAETSATVPLRLVLSELVTPTDSTADTKLSRQRQTEIRWRINPDLPDSCFAAKPPSTATAFDSEQPIPKPAPHRSTPVAVVAEQRPAPTPAPAAREKSVASGPGVGQMAPNFKVKLIGGRQLDLSALRGSRAIVLDFFATWCGPCKMSLPMLAQLEQQFKGQAVDFYVIDQGESEAAVHKFINQQRLGLSVGLDTDNSVGGSYAVQGIPHTVIIGRDGVIKAVHEGVTNDYQQRMTQEIQAAIAG